MTIISNKPTPQVIYQLEYARQKLTMWDLPLELRAVAYLRLCSRAMQKTARQSERNASDIPQISLLSLLNQLTQASLTWWTTCYVTQDRCLESSSPSVQKHLQPLNAFIREYLTYSLVA